MPRNLHDWLVPQLTVPPLGPRTADGIVPQRLHRLRECQWSHYPERQARRIDHLPMAFRDFIKGLEIAGIGMGQRPRIRVGDVVGGKEAVGHAKALPHSGLGIRGPCAGFQAAQDPSKPVRKVGCIEPAPPQGD